MCLDSKVKGTIFSACMAVYKLSEIKLLRLQMTAEKRSEMQMLRHQAMMAETRMRARARQKLLERVHSVINSIDVSYNLCLRSHQLYEYPRPLTASWRALLKAYGVCECK